MSSVRLFLLSELARGPAHGHQLRTRAVEEHTDLWTDFQVGGLYGALKRLAADGLIEAVATEQVGGYPERTVYELTDEGRDALDTMLRDELRRVTLRADPFDLALSRAGELPERELRAVLEGRRAEYASRLASLREQLDQVDARLSDAERYLTRHLVARHETELAWHDALLADLPAVHRSLREGPPAG